MRIIDKACQQWAVYWAPSGTDQFTKAKYTAPVNVRCRWVDSTETFVNMQGQEQKSKAQVQVLQDLLENGVLLLGPGDGLDTDDPVSRLTDSQKEKPLSNKNAWVIARFDKQPILRPKSQADFYRVAFL